MTEHWFNVRKKAVEVEARGPVDEREEIATRGPRQDRRYVLAEDLQ